MNLFRCGEAQPPPGDAPRPPLLRWLGAATVAALTAAAMTQPRSAAPIRLEAAMDVSASHDAAQRRQACAALEAVVDECLAPRPSVDLWAFDRRAWNAGSLAVESGADLRDAEDAEIIRALPGRPAGTTPAAALREMLAASRRADARGERTAVVLFWDGEDCDRKATAKLAGQVAKLRSVAGVWVAGVEVTPPSDFVKPVRQCFAPLLPDRLVVSDRHSLRPGFAEFKQVIRRNCR